ncbi:hypothetical protein Tco_1248368, partial [Tanacetum coccineum]
LGIRSCDRYRFLVDWLDLCYGDWKLFVRVIGWLISHLLVLFWFGVDLGSWKDGMCVLWIQMVAFVPPMDNLNESNTFLITYCDFIYHKDISFDMLMEDFDDAIGNVSDVEVIGEIRVRLM